MFDKSRLTETAPEGCSYRVGDVVTFTNPFGVVFPGRKVIGFDHSDKERPIHIDTDCWWFGRSESDIKKELKPLYAFEDACRHVDSWFGEERRELAKPVGKAELVKLIGGQEVWEQFIEAMIANGFELKGTFSSLAHPRPLYRSEKPIRPCVYATLEREGDDGLIDERDIIFVVGPAWYDNPYRTDNELKKTPAPGSSCDC